MVVQRKYILCVECECCGSTENLTRDHIVPRAFEGRRRYQTLCFKCNQEKGILTIDYRTKTMEITPWMMSLNKKGLKELLSPKTTFKFGCRLLNPTFKNELKYLKR